MSDTETRKIRFSPSEVQSMAVALARGPGHILIKDANDATELIQQLFAMPLLDDKKHREYVARAEQALAASLAHQDVALERPTLHMEYDCKSSAELKKDQQQEQTWLPAGQDGKRHVSACLACRAFAWITWQDLRNEGKVKLS